MNPAFAARRRVWRHGRACLRPFVSIVAAVLLAAPVLDAATVEEKAAPCLACHGADGQSIIPETPSLGGQPEFYLTVQLLMFRDQLRIVEPMNQAMRGLTDEDLRSLAA